MWNPLVWPYRDTSVDRNESQSRRTQASLLATFYFWEPNCPQFHHVHKSPPLVSVVGQMHPVHYFSSWFPKIHSSIREGIAQSVW
jgi:hypothetical protein